VKYYAVQDADLYTPASIQSVQPVNLAVSNQSLDNIIITPSEYLQQANSLAAFYNQNFNKRSKVVLLQDIFNQFNAGMPDPNAVRLYLKHAVNNYPAPALTSLTLLGSGTNDWRNFSGQSLTKNKMIVFQKGTTTTDDYFGMLNTVQYPELVIGRYPSRTQNELNIMLSNLDKYVTEPTPGIWRNSLVFLADDEYNGPTTGEYSHSEQLQDTSNMINKSILIDKIFALEYAFDEFQNKPAARDDMMAAINAGKLIWYYIGHGSFDTLGAEDYFKGALDMGRFDNADKLTLFVAASCDIAQFDSFSFDCLSEKVVLVDNAGAIASIAATRECNGPSNVALLKQYYNYSLNLRNPIGYSLLMAKIVYTEYNTNDEKYNILGDPLLLITTPQRDSTMTILGDDIDNIFSAREQINLQGQYPSAGIDNTASVQVFDCQIEKRMGNNSLYTLRGRDLFKGEVTVTDSDYNTSFVVPDDVTTGNTGLVVSYVWDPLQNKDYVNYLSPVSYSDQSVGTLNPDAPQIELYLDNTDFVSGDEVGTNPLLLAYLSDQNGINITNSPGHSILLIIDQTVATINVTDAFSYDKDSFTSGSLQYQLSGLSEGSHMLQLIAFDNFNRPSVAAIDFVVRKSKSFTIEDFLPYPNPMQKGGYFTFKVSEASEVKLSIYTIRGRKIKTIDWTAAKGYNQIPWDGKDADGDYLANNTYFIKLTAKALSGTGKAEKTEKLVIFK
ncbi:MAG: C25 family cysteine peptidase, partial [Candidatus Cloacimonadaceae bacterium]